MIDKIDNPVFLADRSSVLLGRSPRSALVQARRSGSPETARWIVAGLALYAVAVVVTGAVHVPLNEDLKQRGRPRLASRTSPPVRDDFATPWVAWHIVRDAGNDRGLRLPRLGARLAQSLLAIRRYCGEGKIDSVRPARSSSSRSA